MLISATDYILGMAFIEYNTGNSWILTAKRDEDYNWEMESSFRIKKDNKIFDNNDKKIRHNIIIPKDESEEEVLKELISFYEHVQNTLPPGEQKIVSYDLIIIQGDFLKMKEKLKDKLWFHCKMEKKTNG